MKYMKLPVSSAQKVVDYLVSKPWAEVNELIALIQRSPIENETEEPDGDRCVDDKAGSSEPDPESS